MKASSQRRLAVRVLGRARRDSAWVRSVLDSELARTSADEHTRAFVSQLVLGVTQFEGVLDELIDTEASRPSAIEPQVRDALRVSVYEIIFLDTPDRAAVNEGVELVRNVRPRAAGMANAILRRVAERADEFPFGNPDDDLAALARSTGHPLWLARRLVADIGEDAARDTLKAGSVEAPLYVAVNPFLADKERVIDELQLDGAEPTPLDLPDAILCGVPRAAVRSDALAAGRALVADLSAQIICMATPVQPGSRVLDAAAGRGTKSVLLQAAAARHGGTAHIVANDVHTFKTDVAASRFEALHVPDVEVAAVDATDAPALRHAVGEVDGVFVDAPCSGIGTLRRHPEKRWTLTEQDIERTAALAFDLLDACSQVVAPDGFVVYSTCTVTRAENEDVVSRLLSESDTGFAVESLVSSVPAAYRHLVTDEGYFRSHPVTGGPDGHFAALLRRQS